MLPEGRWLEFMIAAIVALDDKTIGTSTDSKEGQAVVSKALDQCYPVISFLKAEMKQSDPNLTDQQFSCIQSKLGSSLSWAQVDDSSFQNTLTAAASACGGHRLTGPRGPSPAAAVAPGAERGAGRRRSV